MSTFLFVALVAHAVRAEVAHAKWWMVATCMGFEVMLGDDNERNDEIT